MKKHLFFLIALALSAQSIWASDIEPSTSLTTYYAAVDGLSTDSDDDLRKTLCVIISTGYVSTGYSSLPEKMYAASTNPTDFVNGSNNTLEDIYSSKAYVASNAKSSATDCGQGWNKEHTVPQSWFKEASPMKSDAFHVYPTDIKMNSLRSSYPYGETSDESKSCANYGYGRLGESTFAGYTGTVFDPGEGGAYGSYKGDLARTYFYMATRYRTTNFTSGTGNTSFTYSGGVADLTDYMRNLMLKWHREDPVSDKELNRNNAIYAHQNNRNPFIDYPELVEYIWGDKKGQTVKLADLTSAYDGESGGGGGGGGEEPPTPQPVTFSVLFSRQGAIDVINNLTGTYVLPTDEEDACEQWPFAGWSTSEVEATTEKPAFVTELTESADVYAVYAQTIESSNTGTPVETTLTAQQIGAVNTTVGDFTFSAELNGGTDNPTYNTGNYDLRYYAKNKLTISSLSAMTKIVFTLSAQGKKRLPPITADKGTIAEQSSGDASVIWTGEAESVSFTVGDKASYGSESSKAGQLCFSSISITTGGSGSTTTTTYHSNPECPKQTITVIFNADGTEINVDFEEGDPFIIPSSLDYLIAPVCTNGKKFMGWTTNTDDPSDYFTEAEGTVTEPFTCYTVYADEKQETIPETYYQKITTQPEDWSGNYLIVREAAGHAFNGKSSSGQVLAVEINDGIIAYSETTAANEVIIATMDGGYSLQMVAGATNNAGKYLYSTGATEMKFDTNPHANTLSLQETDVKIKCSGAVMGYNTNNGNPIFRYYKSSYPLIQLYKRVTVKGQQYIVYDNYTIGCGGSGEATSVEQTGQPKNEWVKIILDGHLYILRNGQMYDSMGRHIR